MGYTYRTLKKCIYTDTYIFLNMYSVYYSILTKKMESSREGRLGLKSKTHFKWKGRTFSQISSVLQKNNGLESSADKLYFRPLPIKGYRKEIASQKISTNSRSQQIRTMMDAPGSTIVNGQTTTNCVGQGNTLDIQYDETNTAAPCSSCDQSLNKDHPEFRNSQYIQSLSQQDNARRRVRSGGMCRPRYNNTKNGRLDGYMSSREYMHSRNKTFSQNQFVNLRVGDKDAIPGNAASTENVYASNTIQYCGSNPKTEYVPVYYKPSNSKFANQGAVDSGARLLRLKYDTITDGSNKMRQAYGSKTANALAYGVPDNGYTIKDKVGYPNPCTPVFKNGTVCMKR